jgi:hypothetical protein
MNREFVGIGKDSICPYSIILSRLGKIHCEGVDKSEETSLYVRCVSAFIKSYTIVGHIKTVLCCVTYVNATVLRQKTCGITAKIR